MTRLEWYLMAARNLGLWSMVRNKLTERRGDAQGLLALRSKLLSQPILVRPGSSDGFVFGQIFVEREYSCFDDLADVELIIDLGANIGMSAVYFLNRFPSCFVVCVEPDKGNFELLLKNLAPYEGRCIAVQAAVWPEKVTLTFEAASMGANNEWGRRVTSNGAGGESIDAVDVESLVAMTMYRKISLLKVDIEGSEIELFSRNYEAWLDRTQNFCIELHGEPHRDAVAKAIEGCGFTLSSSGELTVGKR